MSTVSSITQTNLNQNTSQTVSSSQSSSQNSSSSTTSSAASISSSTNSTKSKKYSAFDINNIYKGKSLENPKTSVIVPKHGLQTVGKVGAGRRVPPSANICGLKSIAQLNNNQPQTSTNNSLNNNSSGGQGWVGSLSKEDESSSSSSSVKDLKDSNSLDLQYSQTQQPCSNAAITTPDQLPPTDLYSCHSLPENTVSTNTNCLNQSNNQFSKEFPPISNTATDTQTGNNKSAKDANYTGGGGGSRRESMVDLTTTKQPLLPHPKIKDIKPSQSGYPSTGNYVHLDGECEKEKDYPVEQKHRNNVNKNNSHPSYNYNNSSFPSSSSSSNSLLGAAPPPTTTPIAAAAQTTVNTNELFNLPTSGDFHQSKTLDKTNESNRNRQTYNSSSAAPYSSSNSSGHHVRKIKQEKRFAIDKPAIIDDQELKSLDQILKTDLECDWALEQEIDYTAKLEFSDNDTDEEEMEQFIKDQQALSSHHTSKQSSKESSLTKDTSLNDDSQRSNEDNKYNAPLREPPPNRSVDNYHNRHHMDLHGSNYRVPPPNTNMDPHNRYYGRKSDPLYEPTNRNKDNDYYDKGSRRTEYHVSSRSQQLPRGGTCGYSNQQQTFLMQQQHQPSASNYNSAGSSRNPLNGGNNAGPILNRRPDEDWRPKRMKDDQTKMRGKMTRDDDEMMMNRNSLRDYPPERRSGGGTSSTIQGSGGQMYSKSQIYPPPNLPPRLQKQVEMLLNNKNYNDNQRGPGGSGSGRRSPTQQSMMDSQMNGQMINNHRNESRDYRDNDRHRRTPPEYDNSGRNRYKSTSETNWRANKSIIQPQQSISNQDCELHRRNSSELSSSTYDQSKPKYPSETNNNNNNNNQQLQNDSIDSLNDNENNSITNSTNCLPISSESKAQYLDNNNDNKEANDPEKTSDVCDQSKLAETVENQELQQPTVTQSSTSTPLPAQQSATVTSSTDVGINSELCNKNFEETNNHRHNTHRNNNRSYGSQNMDTKRMPRYDGSSIPSERNRHSQPQRKYSNNSIDRFTPPSSCSSNPSPPIVIQRRDNYRTNSGGSSFQSIKSNDHPHSQQSMTTIQPANNNTSTTNNNNRGRTDSNEFIPTSIASSQSPAPVSLPAPISSSLPQQNTQSATTNSTSTTLYPPAPGCSTIRAHTTYGPPPTKLFCDVSSTTSSQSPPIMQQQSNSSITGNNAPSPRALITQQSQTNINTNKNPEQKQHSGGSSRKLRSDRNENRNRNSSERSGNLRSARNVGKNQRIASQAVNAQKMPKSASSSNVPQTSANTNNIQHDQQSQDLNIDEWETASESSDLMERSSGNRKSNENKASSSNSGAILPNPVSTNSTSVPSQTAKNYSAPPAATQHNESGRTVYQSKSSQQQQNHNRHDNSNRNSNRANDLYYSHNNNHSRHSHDSNLFHSYRGMSRGGGSSHSSSTAAGRSFRGSQNVHSTKRGTSSSSHQYQTSSSNRHTELSNQMSKLSLDQHDMKMPPADDKLRNRKNSSNQNLKRDDLNVNQHNEDNSDGKLKANTANNRLSSNASTNSIKSKRSKEKPKSKSNQNRSNRSEHNPSSQHNKDSIARTESISKSGNADVKQLSAGNMKSKSNFDSLPQDSNIESSDHSKAHQQPKLPLCNEQQNSGTKCLTNQSNNATVNSPNNVESTPTGNKQKLATKTKPETPLNISKIPDMDTSTNIINNRKILGTLIYENTKLKEENKVLSKIDEVHHSSSPVSTSVAVSSNVSTNAKAGFGISNTSSSSTVNEELMKIASVKKVWDSPNEPHQSSERKNSLLSGSTNLNSNSPTEKNFDKSNKSLNNTAGQQKKSSPNMFCIPASTPFVQNVTSPTVVEMNRSSYVSGTANFQNPGVIQTPTSPPTLSQMYTNPLAAAQGPQPNLTFQPYGSHQITPDQLNFGTGLGGPQQTTMFPAPHPAAAFMQQGTASAHAAAVAQQNHFNPMAMMVNTVQQQQQHNLIMQFQSVNHDQFNKFPLTTGNPNVLAAQNNLIKPFVQSGGQMNNLQQTTPTGGWPVGAGHNFFTQLAPAPPPSAHFVQNPAVQTSATGGSQAVATSTAFTNRQQATNMQRGQMVDNGSGNPNQMRSFIGPSGSHMTTLNDIHQHNHMSSHQMQNNSHFINDQTAGAGNRGNQPSQTHNISHHVNHHRNQFSNSTNQTGNMNPAAAANWASNQQMFLKMPNGVGRQFPIQLINQPILSNTNPAAALAVAAQLNSRTSPLNAHALMTNSNNYSNPIQRPGTMVPVQQSKGSNLGMSSGQSNRNGGSNSGKSFSNQIGGKPSRQFTNNNRNSTTPSPGQNSNPSASTVTGSSDSSVSNPGNSTGLTATVNKEQG